MNGQGETPPLAELVRRRVDAVYGGKQAAFARAIGVSPQTVNSWLKGKALLPRPDSRRRLAKELGVSHVQFLVMAGELWPEEASPNRQGSPVPSELDAIADDLDESARDALYRMARELNRLRKARIVAEAAIITVPAGNGSARS